MDIEYFLNTPLSEIMILNPAFIDIKEPFSRVPGMLRVNDVDYLPVIDENRKLKGIVTKTDLYRTVSPMKNEDGELFFNEFDLDNYILEYVMTKDVFTLNPQKTIGTAINVMIEKRYRVIPIVDDAKCLVGVVTSISILKKIIGRNAELPIEPKLSSLRSIEITADQFMDLVKRMAHNLWVMRGAPHGNDMQDWLDAEKIIKEKYGIIDNKY